MLSHLVSLNHASLKVHENPNLPSFLQKEHQSNLHSGIFGVASPIKSPPDRSKILPLMGQHHPTSWVPPMKASRNYRKVHPWLLTWNPTIMVDFCFSCFSMWCFSTLFPCLLNLWSCVIFLHVVFSMVFPLKHLQVPMSLITVFCHFSSRWFPAPGLSHRQVSSAIRNGIRRLFFGGDVHEIAYGYLDGCYGFLFENCIQKITISKNP